MQFKLSIIFIIVFCSILSAFKVNAQKIDTIYHINGNNLQIGLKIYYSYDSRPPSNANSTFDWGINFELTYDLH